MKPIYLLVILACLLLTSCKEEKTEGGPEFDRTAMLQNIAENVISPAYEANLSAAMNLNSSFEDFRNEPGSLTLNSLRTSYLEAYANWQQINLFDFGPAESQALKSNLNIYPISENKIETNIENGNVDLGELQNKNAKGYPALDYLLFAFDEPTTLSKFMSDNKAPERMKYLELIIEEILQRNKAVVESWTGSEDYASQFMSQTGTDAGSGLGLLVNALNKHVESDFRDGKIGIPLGIRSSGITLPDNVEAYYSKSSTTLLLKNFEAIQAVYLGNSKNGDGIGLEEHLIGVEASDLDNRIKDQFNLIKASISGIQGSIDDEIEQNPTELTELYSQIQQLIVLLKVELPSRLSVLISYQDNDGD